MPIFLSSRKLNGTELTSSTVRNLLNVTESLLSRFLPRSSEKKYSTNESRKSKSRGHVASRLATLTFVSRPEVHCYENQSSVRISKNRNERTRLFSMKSGRAPVWQVAAPANRSEIRDATPRGVEKKAKKLLESTLQDVDPSWAGTSGLWLRIHLSKNHETAPRYYRWKRRTVGGNLSHRVCWINFSVPFCTWVVKSW